MSFSTREGWEDVIPISQNDGPTPVVAIAYSPKYRELMDLFRAVLQSSEYSERVLELTEEILAINAANYTIWQYRRDCLKSINTDLEEELDYLDNFAEENPKNYQIWHHRRTIVENMGSAPRELDFCANVFSVDSKNYHAWAHRQWVLKTFQLWDGELLYVESLLESDIRNNSAWNQRWYVVHSGPEAVTDQVLARELDFVFIALDKAELNESAWNYLRGLLNHHSGRIGAQIRSRCEAILQCSGGEKVNVHCISLLAELREQEGLASSLAVSKQMYQQLQQLDGMRVKYWRRRADSVQLLLDQLQLAVPPLPPFAAAAAVLMV